MISNPQRKSNSALCYALIFCGFFIMFCTLLLAVFQVNRIIEVVSEPLEPTGISESGQLRYLDQQIRAKEQSIEFEKRIPDMDEFERRKQDAQKRLDEAKTGKSPTGEVNINVASVAENKTGKIKRLEEEKAKLIAEKDDLAGKMRAKQMRPRSFGEWFEDFGIALLVFAVFPLGLFSLYLLRFVVGGRLPARNPLALTDLERRCVLFVPFAIVFSAFGLFLFIWVLDLIY